MPQAKGLPILSKEPKIVGLSTKCCSKARSVTTNILQGVTGVRLGNSCRCWHRVQPPIPRGWHLFAAPSGEDFSPSTLQRLAKNL